MVAFATPLVMASLLSAHDFGVTTLLVTIPIVAASCIGMGAQNFVSREFFKCDQREMDRLTLNCFIFGIATLVAGSMLAAALVALMPVSLSEDSSFGYVTSYFFTIFLATLAFYACDLQQRRNTVECKVSHFGFFEVTKNVLMLVCPLVAILGAATIENRMVGLLSASAILLLVIVGYLVRAGFQITVPEWKILSKILRYSTQVIPQVLSNLIKIGGDKLVVGALLPAEQLGTYALALSVASIHSVPTSAINNAFLPRVMKLYDAGDLVTLGRTRRRLVALLSGCVVVEAAAVAAYFEFAAPEQYANGLSVALILLSAQFINSIYLMYAKYFLSFDKMSQLGVINLTLVVAYLLMCGLMAESGNEVDLAVAYLAYSFLLLSVIYVSTVRGEGRAK